MGRIAVVTDSAAAITPEIFSYKLMEKGKEDFVIVTNYYIEDRKSVCRERV